MGYNVIDLIDKAIKIEQERKNIIMNAMSKDSNYPNIRLISKILVDQGDKRIDYYEKIKEETKNKDFEEIDFMTYDKISFLINEFNKKIYITEAKSPKEYILFSLELARDKYSLFIDIQGRLFNNTKDKNTKAYEILSKIIEVVRKQIDTLEKTIQYIH